MYVCSICEIPDLKERYIFCIFRTGMRWGRPVPVEALLAIMSGRADGRDGWLEHWYRCSICHTICWGSLYRDPARYPNDEELRAQGTSLVCGIEDAFIKHVEAEAAREGWWRTRRGGRPHKPAREERACVCSEGGYEGDSEGDGHHCKAACGCNDYTDSMCRRVCYEQYLDD